MRTWDDYKNHVNAIDPEIAKDIKETEEIAAIVSVMVEQRNGKASVNGKVFDYEPMTMICAFLPFIRTHYSPKGVAKKEEKRMGRKKKK